MEEDKTTAVTRPLYLRGFYAFFFSSTMLRLVYSPVYFKQLGLGSTYTGILNGAGPFINAFGGLLFCYIADKTNTRKFIFLVSLLACVAIPLLLTFPKIPCLNLVSAKGMQTMANDKRKPHEWMENEREILNKSSNLNSPTSEDLGQNHLRVKSLWLQNTGDRIRKKKHKKKSTSYSPNVIHNSRLVRYQRHQSLLHEKKRNLQIDMETQRKNYQRLFIARKRDKSEAVPPTKREDGREMRSDDDGGDGHDLNINDVDNDKTKLFLILLAIVVIGQFVSSPSRNLADTATMFSLENNKADYGKIRLWGNVGQCLFIPSVSLLVYFQKTSLCGIQQDNYKMAMYILAGGSAIAFLIGFKFIFPSTNFSTAHQEKDTSKAQGTVSQLVVPFRNCSFLIIIFFLGTFEGVFNTFMFWFIVDLNQSQSALVVAVATFLRNLTAFATFAASPKILQKFGAINAINIALFLYCVSFLVYSGMTNPWIAIIPEVVQYVSFSLSMAASVTYMGEISPDNLAATAQGIVQFMYSGFGQGVGPMFAGLIMKYIGNHYTFFTFAVISLLVLGFSVGVQLILKRHEAKVKQYQKLSKDED